MATTVLIWATLIVAIFRVCHLFFSKISNYLKDAAIQSLHGCELPPELPKRWPLGIDRIKDLWESNAEGRLLAYLCKVAEDYEPGNNLTQYLLLGPRAFHVLHPSNVEAVLSTNFKDYGFGARPEIFAPLLGNGIFTQEGSAWKHSRELLRKQFVRVQYQNLDHFREHVDNLINRLPSSGIVDLQPLFFDMTLDTVTALLFGRSVYSLRAGIDQQQENKLFAESFDLAQEGLAKRFRIAPWHFLYNPPAFRKACANVHRFVERYIKELDLENAERYDMKQYGFIKQISEDSASLKELRDQLLNVLLAGRDTTACCLSWTFRLLVRHEHAMKRLREEIASVMEGNLTPNRDQIKKMPYLACVIKESLRLYPPVPLNNREAVETTVLPTGGGPDGDKPMLVRKGELVVFSQYVNSRKKNIYGPDAYDFRPERWESGELGNVRWAYFPFSGGPRQCLGEDFAQMEISYTAFNLQSILLRRACAMVKSMEVAQHINGIQELYRPADAPGEVDIVAVHGLNGHATETWSSRPRGICWLSNPDYLPKYIPHARVLAWGYNASISSWNGKTPSSDRVLQHAQTLVSQLESDRDLEDAAQRPIIFVCHSLGGIIVKRALAYAESRSKQAHVHSIYTCTFAILFFGTPHHGSNKASLLGSLQKMASFSIPKAMIEFESGLVNALEKESEVLQNITDQFAPLMPNFRIFFFWEQEKTDFKYKRDYVVDETSAAPILDGTERCGIAADHQGMCKFQSPADQGYRTAVAALRRYARDAPNVIRRRCQRAANLQRDGNFLEASELLEKAQTRVLDSCQPALPSSETPYGIYREQVDDPQPNARSGLNQGIYGSRDFT